MNDTVQEFHLYFLHDSGVNYAVVFTAADYSRSKNGGKRGPCKENGEKRPATLYLFGDLLTVLASDFRVLLVLSRFWRNHHSRANQRLEFVVGPRLPEDAVVEAVVSLVIERAALPQSSTNFS